MPKVDNIGEVRLSKLDKHILVGFGVGCSQYIHEEKRVNVKSREKVSARWGKMVGGRMGGVMDGEWNDGWK